MARRKQGLLDDLIDISAKLPWWGGVALAVVAYAILHALAIREVATTVTPGQLGTMVQGQIIKSLAMVGQYLLPFAFLVGAGVSAWRQRKRGRLLEDTGARGRQSALLDMSWHEFEMLVGEAFRRKGYSVVETGGNGPDGGVDLVLKKGTETHLVQCKQWKAFKVGVDVVRAHYGVMAAQGAAGGYVVTSGRFTADAREFARDKNIELIEGDRLLAMIQSVRTAKASGTSHAAATPVAVPPACPRCGGSMVRRVAKMGSNAGKSFWGCSAFPSCKGIVPIDD